MKTDAEMDAEMKAELHSELMQIYNAVDEFKLKRKGIAYFIILAKSYPDNSGTGTAVRSNITSTATLNALLLDWVITK